MKSADIVRSVSYRLGHAGKLEVVTHESKEAPFRGDLLFIHGAWSSSWYWESYLMPWFARRGYRCHAVSLRGHGGSSGNVRWASIKNYVADVQIVADTLDNPVIIGHSMGAFVAQKYAAKNPVRAIGLLASIPPSGAWHALWKVITRHPSGLLRSLASLDLYGVVSNRDTARSLLYSRTKSQTDKDHLLEHCQSESLRAFIDMLVLPIRKRLPKDTPVFVLGAERDQIITARNTRETARFHNVDATTLPLAAHMLTVDDPWELAAVALEYWLEGDVLKRTSGITS